MYFQTMGLAASPRRAKQQQTPQAVTTARQLFEKGG